jgi:hypothetical protein
MFNVGRSMFPLLLVSGLWLLVSRTSPAIIDENQNGVSDPWEQQHNDGDLFSTFDPNADPDLDGWTNEQEAAAGTDPLDPNPPNGFLRPEYTHVPAFYGVENGQPIIITPESFTITWPVIPGKQYTLQFSFDLTAASWITVGTPFIAGNAATYGFPVAEAPKRFWRVKVEDVDTDNDGLSNAEEAQLGTDPNNPDTDGDGLGDKEEITEGTNPTIPDTDNDGLNDSEDAEPKDAEINWKRTPEARYVWIEQVIPDHPGHFPTSVNKNGMIVFSNSDLLTGSPSFERNLWDSSGRIFSPKE